MAKKQPNNKKDVEIKEIDLKPIKAYVFKKITLSEWQIIELTVLGDTVVNTIAREPDLPQIVVNKLIQEIRKV